MHWPILSSIILFPALGALLIAIIAFGYRTPEPSSKANRIAYGIAQFISSVTFGFALPTFLAYTPGIRTPQFVERLPWIPSWGITYEVGLDDLNILLFLLTTFLTPLACLVSRKEIEHNGPAFYSTLLFLESALLGVFAARDMFLFYLYWELTLVPMFFIILLWGGSNRLHAAVKFFLYTFLGSLFMLVGIITVYIKTGATTFSWDRVGIMLQKPGTLSFHEEIWLFLAFAIAFLVKIPAVPFHTWLPAAHVEAPTPGSVLLAGILLKMGGYGLLRFCIPFFPAARIFFQWPMVLLGIIGIIYGSWAALAQRDIKRMVAYSSIAHLGLVIVGLFSFNLTAVKGAILEMVNHGISTGALFMLVGVLYGRTHTRDLNAFGGLLRPMPKYYAVFLIVTLASIGVPLTNGFVGEFLILFGAFQRYPLSTLVALTVVIWSAVYMLQALRMMFYGKPASTEYADPVDLNAQEFWMFVPVILMIFLIGLWPSPFLARTAKALSLIGLGSG